MRTEGAWKSVTLGGLVKPVKTWNPSRSPADELMDYIDLSAVDQESKQIVGHRKIKCGEAPSRARQLVAYRDVLVSTVRPNLNGVSQVPASLDGATASTGFCILRADDTKLDGSYLFQWVKSQRFVEDMVKKATGASYPAVSDKIIFDSHIPLPPLAEQRRIAEVLDRAEALRAKRRATLALLDSLTQSLFLELFGDPSTNPKGWPKKALKDCTEKIQIGPFGSLLHQEDYVSDGISIVNPKHIQGGVLVPNAAESVTRRKFDQLQTYHLRQGDVVMGRRGEMGRCAIVSHEEPLLCGTGSLIIRPDRKRTIALFLWAILTTKQSKEAFERLSLGQTLPNLNSGIVEKFKIPLPPLSLQHEFARQITAMEKLKAAQRASLAELDALFVSLQHRAFRGEL